MPTEDVVELADTHTRVPLESLYARHAGKVSDTWSAYLREYDRILSIYRDRAINLLEIGVQNGGSLEIWSEYFHNAKAIVGCDINPACDQLRFDDARVVLICGDANSDESERRIVEHAPWLDIVIDDGSHRSSDIVKSFARYFPRLRDGGVFLVEDLHCSYWSEFEGGLFHPAGAMTFLKRLADVVNHEHWGVPEGRTELLASFSDQYGVTFSEQELARIHAIEFSNSMCVIHKAPAAQNELGARRIVGKEALVYEAVIALDGQRNTDLVPQTDNPWSSLASDPNAAAEQLRTLRYVAEERASALASMSQELIAARAVADERATALANLSHELIQTRAVADERAALLANNARELLETRAVAEERATALAKLSGDLEQTRTLANERASQSVLLTEQLAQRGRQADALERELASAREECARMTSTILELRQHGGLPSSRPPPAPVARPRPVSASPLVTVVIPSYNHRRFIFAAVDSVLAQTHQNLELIIIDDGSSDDSVAALRKRYAGDARVTVIARENRGAHQTINEAIARGKGEFITILNSDDVYDPKRLERLLATARANGGHPFFGITALRVVDETGKPSVQSGPLSYYASVLDKFEGEPDPAAFWVGNLAMTTSNFFFSREVFEQIGGFSPLRYTHDWDWGLRAAERFKLVRIDEVLLHYRVHGTNTISEGNFWKHVSENAYVFASAMRRAGLARMADVAGLRPVDVMRALVQNESFAPLPTLYLLALGLDEEQMMSLLKSGALEATMPEISPELVDLMMSAQHIRQKLKAPPKQSAALAPSPKPGAHAKPWGYKLRKAGARWRRRLTGDPL